MGEGMIIIGCGGRMGQKRGFGWVWNHLDDLSKIDEIKMVITGEGGRTDEMISQWAENRGIDQIKCPANWVKRGRSAGFQRNALMLRILIERTCVHTDRVVVAFPGGPGTANMIRLAHEAGVRVIGITETIVEPPFEIITEIKI
jgi:hypothetical protein